MQGMGLPGGISVPSLMGLGMKMNMPYDPAAVQQMMANMAQMQQQQQQQQQQKQKQQRQATSATVVCSPTNHCMPAISGQSVKINPATVAKPRISFSDFEATDTEATRTINLDQIEKETAQVKAAIDHVEAPIRGKALRDNESVNGDASELEDTEEDDAETSRGLKRLLSNVQFVPQKKRRSKEWSKSEEMCCEILVDAFRRGLLKDCFRSCTLQAYLATKLHCNPKRIAFKFRSTKLNPARIVYEPAKKGIPESEIAAMTRELGQFQSVFERNLRVYESKIDDLESADEDEKVEYDDDGEHYDEIDPLKKIARSRNSSEHLNTEVASATNAPLTSSSTVESTLADSPCMWATSSPGIWIPFDQAMSMVKDAGPSTDSSEPSSDYKEDSPVFTTSDYMKLIEITRSQIAWSVTNELGAFLDCTETFSKVTGFSREEIRQKTIFDLTLVRDMQKNIDVLKEMIAQNPAEMPSQFLLRGMSSEKEALLIILQLMRDESGGTTGISCCVLPQDSNFPILQQDTTKNEEHQCEEH